MFWTIGLWVMVSCQMIAWLYLMHRGEKITKKGYLIFTVGMMLGQLGAGIDCFIHLSWPTFAVQAFFFLATLYGALRRFKIL